MAGLSAELERLPVGVLQVRLDGRIHAINGCLGGWLGSAPSALLGQPVDQILSRPGRVLYHTHLVPTLRLHGQVQELSLSLQSTSGRVQVLCSASLLGQPGQPDSLLAELVMSPMRERLRIEAELARVQRSADAAPVVLFECVREVDGRSWLNYASAGLVSLYGLTAESVSFTDAPWLACVQEDDRAELLARRDASAESRTMWTAQFRARAGSGPWRQHRLRAQPYAEPDGRMVWYGTIVDATEQVAVEDAERERDAAERANRSKSEFLARMSHELRTPLNAIIGFSHLLDADPALADSQAHQRLGIIHTAGQQLLTLIDEVLDISRIESGRLQLDLAPVALGGLVEQVCQSLEPARLARGLTLTLPAAPSPAVQADEARLRQVLNNLVSNAIKYTREAGWVAVDVTASATHAQVRVRDNGPGLSPTQQQQLFQPFNRLGAERSRVQGTGLGLVITRHLVESMGGTLSVESAPGEGCCFSVELPLASTPPDTAQDFLAPVAPTPPAGRSWQVLYTEDDPVNALLMQAVLERIPGVTLHVAGSGAEACRLAESQVPDLLMLDMTLPDMDGRELLQRLRADPRLASVPAVAVSADAMPDEIRRTLASGFDAYWTKPLDIEHLPAALHALLSRASPMA
ncbi:MAG: response regulator [Burkholderiales bacterium]|nr:MAG: response regulator [Burkholderiales bacterium]